MKKKVAKNYDKPVPLNWITNFADYLYNFAYVRVNNKELSEDLVQDTFVSALKSLDNFKAESNERTWLTTILKNKIIDHYRKKSRQNKQDLHSENENSESSLDYFFNQNKQHLGDWNSNTAPNHWKTEFETPYDRKEFHKILEDCLSKLPERWSMVFKLKHYDDCTREEICKELLISSSNYWVIIHRVKLQLRECLEKNWYNQ